MLSETNWIQQNGTKYEKIFELSIGVIKHHTLICTLTRDNYVSCVGNASKLIQNTKPTKCTVFFVRYLCYNTVLLHVSIHEGSSENRYQLSNVLQRTV